MVSSQSKTLDHFGPLCLAPLLVRAAAFSYPSNLHLLQVFVSWVLIAMVLHLVQMTLLWGKHWVNLHNPMADGPILPLPQHHQADDYDCGYGNCNHQETDEGAAA